MDIIITNDNQAEVYTPYNKAFISALKKKIGSARWNEAKKCWTIPGKAVDLVREIMLLIYGETDIAPQPHVDVKVTFNSTDYEDTAPYVLFGKIVAAASGRGSGARLGKDIELIEGKVTSGGSLKNWKTIIQAGTIIIMRDVCKTLVDGCQSSFIETEVLGDATPDLETLLREKERLLARIKEIDNILEK